MTMHFHTCHKCDKPATNRTMKSKPGTLSPLFDVWWSKECYDEHAKQHKEGSC